MPLNRVTDLEIDEVSMVDIPANQHASVVIAKRAQEATVPQYFDFDGQPIDDVQALEVGTQFQDEDGNLFELEPPEADERADELVGAGISKSVFLEQSPRLERARAAVEPVSKGMLDTLRQELSKAVSEEDRARLVDRTFEAIAKRDAEVTQELSRATEIAKAERDLRLTKEYVSKAAEYNVPIDPEELGPVLMRMAAALEPADQMVIHKALASTGELLAAVGYDGGASETDPLRILEDELEDELADQVSKGVREPISKQQALVALFDDNPDLYDQHRAQAAR